MMKLHRLFPGCCLFINVVVTTQNSFVHFNSCTCNHFEHFKVIFVVQRVSVVNTPLVHKGSEWMAMGALLVRTICILCIVVADLYRILVRNIRRFISFLHGIIIVVHGMPLCLIISLQLPGHVTITCNLMGMIWSTCSISLICTYSSSTPCNCKKAFRCNLVEHCW